MHAVGVALALQGPGDYFHWCPGCRQLHLINTAKRNTWGAIWSFNGDTDKPTFSPSVNIVGRCHYFITAGRIQYMEDCLHDLRGKTIDLPPLPEWVLKD